MALVVRSRPLFRKVTFPMSDDAAECNRVYWASRRGMLELDLVLMPYAKERYPQLSQQEREAYQQLLDCEDTELFAWFLQKATPDDALLAEVVTQVLDFARRRPA
jgi:antitoxin CptB